MGKPCFTLIWGFPRFGTPLAEEIIMRKTIRNIFIFVFVALSCGWFGVFADKNMPPQPVGNSLGMGIWLVFPLLSTIILRFFEKDGWKDTGLKPNFKGNVKWYFSSLLIFPFVTVLVMIIGKLFGWIDFSNFRAEAYFTSFTGLLIVNFVRNFFEEAVWRGYLTAKLLKTKIKDIWLYIIVGGVWSLWHLPYYLFFLPEAAMYEILPVGKFVFVIVSIFTMTVWAVMFIELYRLTGTIWSVVLLHAVEDSVINHLVIDGHITIFAGKEILISPVAGIITTVLYLCIGLLLRKYRIEKESRSG